MQAKISTVVSITKASVALHNFLMKDRIFSDKYCPTSFIDNDSNGRVRNGEWRDIVRNDTGLLSVGRCGANNYGSEAKKVRDSYSEYFCSVNGEVPWQWEMYAVEVND